jgi:WD40 repeat protein
VGSISDQEAVVGTESGAVCLIDDREGTQKLCTVVQLGFGVTSLAVDFDRECVWLGGRGRRMQRLSFEDIRSSLVSTTPMSPARMEKGAADKKSKAPPVTCMGSLSSHLVTVEATREIHIYPMDSLKDEGEQVQEPGENSMPAHRDPVLGIRRLKTPNAFSADFFSWSRNGSVNFWEAKGKCLHSKVVPFEQNQAFEDDIANELKVLRAGDNADWFVSGDKFGVLRLLSREPWGWVDEARAHGAEITDIAINSTAGSCLIASSGRDRTVQLFEKKDNALQLIQTMDDHVGAVGQIMFMNDGEKLLSSSADRTILVRERATREVDGVTSVAYLISRVITLKSSPVSMTFCPDDSNLLFVSTMDRCIFKFDIPSGRQVHCFRASDSEATDAVIMSALTVTSEIPGQCPKLLLGVSSTDKSIRVYDLERDLLLTGEFGHTEGVSDVLLLEDSDETEKSVPKRNLISAGMDGILMIWNLSVQQQISQDLQNGRDDEGPVKEMTAAKPPLRKVLSRSELAGFRPENPLGTPTPVRELSPTLTRKMSKLSLTPSTLKNNSLAETPSPPNRRSPTSFTPTDHSRRSPSPVSPKTQTSTYKKPSSARSTNRRTSMDFRSRAKASSRSEFGSLDMSTEQVCRTLRAYRKKLNGSSQQMKAQKELERELNLTLRAVSARSQTSDESAETETDSSGKDMDRKPSYSSISSRSPHMPRHMPSTPLLRHTGARDGLRSRSYDANADD